MDYVNVPPSIGFVVTSGLATLAELQTTYGLEDLWDLIEIHAVNCHNRNVVNRGKSGGLP